MQSSSQNTWTPHCREYCNGNVVEFYCPECAAMFCGDCYDKEHCGNERKSQHGKLTELRAICKVHKHTLDYFNLTLLQPMCILCKKETMLTPECEHHVIDHMETTVPKLRSLMEKKLESASEMIDRLNHELARVENVARNTMVTSVGYIQCCFARLRQLLDEREVELLTNVRKYFDDFVEFGEGRMEARNAVRDLKALSDEGKLLLNKDARSLVVEFPSMFMQLKDLCSSSVCERQTKRLKITIDFETDILDELRQLGIMKSYTIEQTADEKRGCSRVANTSDCSSSFDCKKEIPLGMRRHFSHPPSQKEPSNHETRAGTTHVVSFDLTEVSNKSLSTPLKATTVKSFKITSPSPRKRTCKPTARKSAQSPEWTPASPIQTPCVASPRRKRGGELSKEFKKCDIILTELWAQDESCPFVRPVDKKQSPDYYQVIKNPMDLSIIREKLHSLQYASAVDFVKDIRLMLSNCARYNQPGCYIFAAGEALGSIFNRLLEENFPNFENVLLEDNENNSASDK